MHRCTLRCVGLEAESCLKNICKVVRISKSLPPNCRAGQIDLPHSHSGEREREKRKEQKRRERLH